MKFFSFKIDSVEWNSLTSVKIFVKQQKSVSVLVKGSNRIYLCYDYFFRPTDIRHRSNEKFITTMLNLVYNVNYVNDTACILLTLLTLTLFLQNLRLRELRRNEFGSQFSNNKRQKLLKTIFHSSANNEHFSPQNHTALFSA